MDLPEQNLEVRLWREDLRGFYRFFLKTVVLDLDGFEKNLDTYENSTISLRKFRTAMLIGISLVREKIFDKRWMLEKLLGPCFRGYFSSKESMNRFLDAILSTPEAREHVKRASEYLSSDADWHNPAIQSVEGQKAIRVAMMRSAVKTHDAKKHFSSFIPYYGNGIKIIW